MSTLVTVFVRHKPTCRYASDETYRRCTCRKHLRWVVNGTQYRKSADTRSWQEAEKVKRDIEDQLAGTAAEVTETAKNLSDAVAAFLDEKRVRNVAAPVQAAYARELDRLVRHCAAKGIFTAQAITRETLTAFCATWPDIYPSSYTRVRVRERLQGFVKFAYDNEWMRRKLPLPPMVIDEPPTMPLTAAEFDALITKGVSAIADERDRARCLGLFLLMRWSGLAIRDALTLRRDEMHKDEAKGIYRVVTERQKTGTHVSVPIRAEIAEQILSTPNDDTRFIFWDGKRDAKGYSAHFGTRFVNAAYTAAGIVTEGKMKSHRLRDTFAVDLLEKGVPMEEVSKLLGHESIRTTEKHYAKWVKGRQDRLDSLVMGTWRNDAA